MFFNVKIKTHNDYSFYVVGPCGPNHILQTIVTQFRNMYAHESLNHAWSSTLCTYLCGHRFLLVTGCNRLWLPHAIMHKSNEINDFSVNATNYFNKNDGVILTNRNLFCHSFRS